MRVALTAGGGQDLSSLCFRGGGVSLVLTFPRVFPPPFSRFNCWSAQRFYSWSELDEWESCSRFGLKGLIFNPGGISMAHAPFQIPRDGAPVEEVLKSLGTQFSLDDAVIKGLLAAKIGHIEEFRFFFDAEEKITPWVQKLNLGEEHNIQCARLRRAWSAV